MIVKTLESTARMEIFERWRVWRIKPEISGFCLNGNGSIYCSTGHQVNIYLPNGVTVLVEDLECVKGFCS